LQLAVFELDYLSLFAFPDLLRSEFLPDSIAGPGTPFLLGFVGVFGFADLVICDHVPVGLSFMSHRLRD
jgi:hypothetical protein